MAVEIVDCPIKNGGSFHGKMLVHQRVVDFTFEKMVIFATHGMHFLAKFLAAGFWERWGGWAWQWDVQETYPLVI